MNPHKQFEFKSNKLILYVKKVPIWIRIILIVLSISSFVASFYGIMYLFTTNEKFNFLSIIFPVVAILTGIQMGRFFLWNTYGKELIHFTSKGIEYIADYGWFKDGKQDSSDLKISHFTVQENARNKGKTGRIILEFEHEQIECVTQLALDQCEEIKRHLIQANLLYNDDL